MKSFANAALEVRCDEVRWREATRCEVKRDEPRRGERSCEAGSGREGERERAWGCEGGGGQLHNG